jgi:hypothetical protein
MVSWRRPKTEAHPSSRQPSSYDTMGWGKRPVKNAGYQGEERMDAAAIIRIHQETPTVKSFRLGLEH